MLRKFAVENSRNFNKKIEIDFTDSGRYQYQSDCLKDGLLSKVLLYGRNGTGKTNFGKSLVDIVSTLTDVNPSQDSASLVYLNADSDLPLAKFSYEFQFDQDIVQYSYAKNSDQITIEESLYLNNNVVFLRKEKTLLEFKEDYFGALDPTNYLEALADSDNSNTLPCFRWVLNAAALPDSSPFKKLKKYVSKMRYVRAHGHVSPYASINEKNALRIARLNFKELENFLKKMGFECSLTSRQDEAGRDRLYFDFKTLVPFYENASSGVKALAEIYSRLHPVIQDASFIYFDEFDAFFHYEMAENFFKYMKRFADTQMIFTTHNTNLFSNRICRPDCILLISTEHNITPIYRATERELREGHNLEKMYVSGEFHLHE